MGVHEAHRSIGIRVLVASSDRRYLVGRVLGETVSQLGPFGSSRNDPSGGNPSHGPQPPPSQWPGPQPRGLEDSDARQRPVWQIIAAAISALGAVAAAVIGVVMTSGGDGSNNPPSGESSGMKSALSWSTGGEFPLMSGKVYDIEGGRSGKGVSQNNADFAVVGDRRDRLSGLNGASLASASTGQRPSVEQCAGRLDEDSSGVLEIKIGYLCLKTAEGNIALIHITKQAPDSNGVTQVWYEASLEKGWDE